MPQRILIISPHPDDETLACGGTIAKKVKEGHDVSIIFFTDGRNSHLHTLGITSDPSPNELAQIRIREAHNACRILGVRSHNLIFLGYTSNIVLDKRHVVENRVIQIILNTSPGEIYYPDIKDSHPTHKATHEIVKSVLKKVDCPSQEFRYVIWGSTDNFKKDDEWKYLAVDIKESLSIKKKAIAEYKSQVTIFSKYQTQPLLSQEFIQGFLKGREFFFS